MSVERKSVEHKSGEHKKTTAKIGVLIMTLVMIGMNVLATLPVINGQTTQQVSDAYPNLFTPVGRTFSIWGLIYLAALAFAIVQMTDVEKNMEEKTIANMSKLRICYMCSCALNGMWLFFWQYNMIPITLVLMLGLLASLLGIMVLLHKSEIKGGFGMLIKTTFGLYAGWITIATIANVTIFLVSLGWDGGSAREIWTIAILIVGALIGGTATFHFKNPAYGAVLIWAFFGILQQHMSGGIYRGEYQGIVITLMVCMALFLVDIILSAKRMLQQEPPKKPSE